MITRITSKTFHHTKGTSRTRNSWKMEEAGTPSESRYLLAASIGNTCLSTIKTTSVWRQLSATLDTMEIDGGDWSNGATMSTLLSKFCFLCVLMGIACFSSGCGRMMMGVA